MRVPCLVLSFSVTLLSIFDTMKKSPSFILVTLTSLLLLTTEASAQIAVSATGAKVGISQFSMLIELFTSKIISSLGTLFLSAGVVVFFYGVVQYIWGLRQGDPSKAKIGNSFMTWSLVALFVMFSVYGIIKLAQSIIPGLSDTTISVPRVNFGTGATGYTCTPNAYCDKGGSLGTCNAAGTACQ